ncbi:NHLP bacteriocin system secretion protein [Bradyrhizobium sp. STM 3809]|uniref:NHLP bacteriocin system secretion protein n=1 Tax=Bradyrhizobium sp. STM 3809 TaxID=551936 RepID=UPI00024097FC|nr:NHLP bacteriocin system secretion protein [Bradyrhizobium sp. STM 3809]CCE01411.1 Membrane-fusion protein [Bradyrhizobium sp. STM 3809]
MSDGAERIFRVTALQRAASPEQLDHLVSITRPLDWILTLVVCLALTAGLAWGILGRVPTRVSGQGILVGGGRVADAVSAAAGRLAAIGVTVGDHVERGQTIAEIAQTDIEKRYENSKEVVAERQRQYDELAARTNAELAAKAENFAKLEAAFGKVIQATEQRIQLLATDVKNLEDLLSKGYTTRKNYEDRRLELTDAQQRRDDTQNEILKLRLQKTDLETQRGRELQQSQFELNNARRQMNELSNSLGTNSLIVSPISGRVIEIKISTGSVLAAGTPVILIEDDGVRLEALIYLPANQGKTVKPGMQVHLAPNTIKREEYGTMLGTVSAVSDFPVTPQGMAAVLHNDSLVSQFTHDGPPYGVTVELQREPANSSGYRWTVGKGPDTTLTSGTLASAEITTRNQRPLDLVLPLIKKFTGTDG